MRRAGHQRHRERGIAVIEAMIALAVIAAMIAMLFASLSSFATHERLVRDRRAAVLVARSLLEQASGPDGPVLRPRGSDGEFAWSIATSPYGGGAFDSGPALQVVTVSVARAGSSRALVQLRTLRFGR